MRKPAAFLFFTALILGAVFFIAAPTALWSGLAAKIFSNSQFASIFFIESVKPEALKRTVALANVNPAGKKLRILVVPGHDNEFWGTQFGNLKEADMTLALGKRLSNLLAADGEFEILMARDDTGYNPFLSSYFSTEKQDILDFAHGKKQLMNNLISDGKLAPKTNGVPHNIAPDPVVIRLYGINKWANENNVDLVVHVHFNDYPRRSSSMPGNYSGFAIYVPEHQYSNARASKDIADSVAKHLKIYYPESNMPRENAGVVEDQDLIAIGSFNTLDPASILIEYGYIYEPQFLNADIRSKLIDDLATETYVGIHDFFGIGAKAIAGKFNSSLLPHVWARAIKPGMRNNFDILSLQAALALEGIYPPPGFDAHDCPMSGSFGACTQKALMAFQQKYNITDPSGNFGTATVQKLNELYGG